MFEEVSVVGGIRVASSSDTGVCAILGKRLHTHSGRVIVNIRLQNYESVSCQIVGDILLFVTLVGQ